MFNVFEKIEILYWRKKENDEKQGKFIRIRKGSQKLAEVVCFTINHGFVGGTAVISNHMRSQRFVSNCLWLSGTSFFYRIAGAIISRDVSFLLYVIYQK